MYGVQATPCPPLGAVLTRGRTEPYSRPRSSTGNGSSEMFPVKTTPLYSSGATGTGHAPISNTGSTVIMRGDLNATDSASFANSHRVGEAQGVTRSVTKAGRLTLFGTWRGHLTEMKAGRGTPAPRQGQGISFLGHYGSTWTFGHCLHFGRLRHGNWAARYCLHDSSHRSVPVPRCCDLMPEKVVAAPDSSNRKTALGQRQYQLGPGDARSPAHAAIVTRWMPMNSRLCWGTPCTSRHNPIASRTRSVTSSRDRACVWAKLRVSSPFSAAVRRSARRRGYPRA